MQFNSYLFIMFFLPISIIGYYFLNLFHLRLGLIYLLGMSLWFYGYFNRYYLTLLIVSITVNFLLSRFMSKGNIYIRKILLSIGICFNIGAIFYFKYYDFFISNINRIFQTRFNLNNVLLPLGISFFTFQQVSYLIDAYNGKTKEYSFVEYSLFVTFFPQLVAGPIVLHDELIPFFRDHSIKRVNYDNLTHGIIMFTFGLFNESGYNSPPLGA